MGRETSKRVSSRIEAAFIHRRLALSVVSRYAAHIGQGSPGCSKRHRYGDAPRLRDMVSRRSTVIEWLLAVVALGLQLYSSEKLRQRPTDAGSPRYSTRAVAAGILYQLGYHHAYDRDWGQLRSNRYHGLLYGFCSSFVQRRLFSTDDFRYGFTTGGLVGTILYRSWYGVLRPAPGEAA